MLDLLEIDETPVRVWRKGSGGTLVFLHGIQQQMGDAPFLRSLAERVHVVAPEHPGFGETGGFDRLHDLTDLVLHYRRVLEAVAGDRPVTLIGHSLGGMFAAEIAAFCPDLVDRLVLVNSYGLWLDEAPMPDYFVMQKSQLDAALWATREPVRLAQLKAQVPPETDDNLAQNTATATKFIWPLPDRGLARRLRHIKAPTLVIHGTEDGLIPLAHARALASAIPGAELRTIAKAGHYPMIEAEPAFMAALDGFVPN